MFYNLFSKKLFLEIKRRQELIDQRKQLRQMEHESQLDSMDFELIHSKLDLADSDYQGCSLSGGLEAEESTNLYLGNLSPEVILLIHLFHFENHFIQITEEFLCQRFGKYGHITSVKIMYPRSEEERARRRHCGFVSFENRDMADAARSALDGEEFYNMPIRIG
jgi:U2-associated protein SR140